MAEEQKFTLEDLHAACDDLATLKYFPKEARAAVILELSRMCPHRQALQWLIRETLSYITSWPGLAELRGLLCTRFDAADGIDHHCNLPGYSPLEMEAKHYEQHQQFKSDGYIAEESQELIKRLGRGLRQIVGAP